MTNIIEKAGSVKVQEGYNIRVGEMEKLFEISKSDIWAALSLAFNYGYLKGTRAAKAQQKKERMKDHE